MIVERPDLSTRTTLSKSALVGFDLCQTKAYFELTDRRPSRPSEKLTFGSALDAAIEALVTGAREGWIAEKAVALAGDAARYVQERDGLDIDTVELARAVRGFWEGVVPLHDWSAARTQVELRATIAGLGEIEGHPDILLPGAVWDVKSSARYKDMPSLELGLYGILAEEAEGIPVTEVGYFTWVRSGKGRWVTQRMEFTDAIRAWTWANARRYAGARELGEPRAFSGGPKFPGLCSDCQYAPQWGGPCEIAWMGEDE